MFFSLSASGAALCRLVRRRLGLHVFPEWGKALLELRRLSVVNDVSRIVRPSCREGLPRVAGLNCPIDFDMGIPLY